MTRTFLWIEIALPLLASMVFSQSLVPDPPGGERFQKKNEPYCMDRELCNAFKQLYFSSPTTGYVVDDWHVFRTTNGGATWVPVLGPSSGHSRSGGEIFFVNDSTFFVFSDPPLRTTDGGTTFTTLSNIAPSHRAKGATDRVSLSFFLDVQHGWGTGTDAVVATTDGAQTWQTFDMRSGVEPPAQVWMFDESQGLGMAFRRLLRTEDGGQKWKVLPNTPALDRVRCGRNGFCVGMKSRDSLAHISTDQGRTWQATQPGIDPERDSVHGVHVIAAGGAAIVGSHRAPGAVLRNFDIRTPLPTVSTTPAPPHAFLLRWDGSTWQRTDYPDIGTLRTVFYVTASDVWASADLNGLLHSTDGAQTWTFVPDYYRQAAALTPAPTPLFIVTPPPTP